ncbi:MAG: ATP-dependent sacrificial sulfur transferase LarE [Planctomycetia bacterium]
MNDVGQPRGLPRARNAGEASERLAGWLLQHAGCGALLALSGGADSAFLLDACARVLGPGRLLAVTSRSESLPPGELEAARAQAAATGVEHLALEGSELDLEAFRRNAPDRCFHCKDALYGELARVAAQRGLPLVLDGTNADDLDGHRPGYAAGLRHAVRSPLLECGIGKDLVRQLSRERGLATWDKPAEACLSSRFPHGTEVTPAALLRVAACEAALKALGLRTVRVRVHDPVARIEVPPEDLPRLLAPGVREQAVAALKAQGFAFVALDLEGYRSGSLQEPLRGPAPGLVTLAPLPAPGGFAR